MESDKINNIGNIQLNTIEEAINDIRLGKISL